MNAPFAHRRSQRQQADVDMITDGWRGLDCRLALFATEAVIESRHDMKFADLRAHAQRMDRLADKLEREQLQ